MHQFFKQVARLSGQNLLILGAGTAIHRCASSFFYRMQKPDGPALKPRPQSETEPVIECHSPKK